MKRFVPVIVVFFVIAAILLFFGRARRSGRTYEDAVLVMDTEGGKKHG